MSACRAVPCLHKIDPNEHEERAGVRRAGWQALQQAARLCTLPFAPRANQCKRDLPPRAHLKTEKGLESDVLVGACRRRSSGLPARFRRAFQNAYTALAVDALTGCAACSTLDLGLRRLCKAVQ